MEADDPPLRSANKRCNKRITPPATPQGGTNAAPPPCAPLASIYISLPPPDCTGFGCQIARMESERAALWTVGASELSAPPDAGFDGAVNLASLHPALGLGARAGTAARLGAAETLAWSSELSHSGRRSGSGDVVTAGNFAHRTNPNPAANGLVNGGNGRGREGTGGGGMNGCGGLGCPALAWEARSDTSLSRSSVDGDDDPPLYLNSKGGLAGTVDSTTAVVGEGRHPPAGVGSVASGGSAETPVVADLPAGVLGLPTAFGAGESSMDEALGTSILDSGEQQDQLIRLLKERVAERDGLIARLHAEAIAREVRRRLARQGGPRR